MILRLSILTISDRSSRGERPDASGPALAGLVRAQGWHVVKQEIVADELEMIKATFRKWCDSGEIDVILATGGTGFAPRDVTPEATRAVVERLTPGLDEAMRAASLQVTPHAMLSRAVSGVRKHTLIVNLPGSPKGATENLQVILPALEHAIQLLREEDAGH
ncbi:MAG: MogA/MoaB family molybdenum cofactor biosynthesis protein [Anaerolineales bacterium]|jgi:molybdenum cofactor synthesis domain-containing protein